MNSVQTYLNSRENFNTIPYNKNDEEWKTKRKIETVTTKNLERQVKRQVVLDDGRVISEDAPEVTLDVTEDRQSHEESGDEDRKVANDWRPSGGDYGNGSVSARGENVLGEKFQRNIRTHAINQNSVTTAAANNLGELKNEDVDKVIKYGRDVRHFARPFDGGKENSRALTVPARIIHKNKLSDRTVDTEDVREVNRMQNGRLVTDRYVTREVVKDDGRETPEEGSSTEDESYDADAHGYNTRKEERFVDYYKVPVGRPTSEGKYIRRGIHLSSQDKDSRRMDPWSKRSRSKALTYDDQSDSTTNWSERPPRPERSTSRNRSRMSNDEKRRNGSTDRTLDYQRRFHTIERSNGSPRRNSEKKKYYDGSSTLGRKEQYDSDRSYRSRSISRTSMGPAFGRNKDEDKARKSSTLRPDLDPARESRLKRAMSFTSTKSGGGGDKYDRQSREGSRFSDMSFMDSMKSLYSSITKGHSGKKKPSRVEHANKDWFDKSEYMNRPTRPTRPPRRNRGSSYLGSGGEGGSSTTYDRAPVNGRGPESSLYSDNSTGRRWNTFSGGKNNSSHAQHTSSSSTSPRKPQPRPRTQVPYGGSTANLSDSRIRNNAGERRGRSDVKLERRKTISSYDDMLENRDPPRFEEHRHRELSSSRFFGQDGDSDDRERAAPNMRKYLLSSVNLARRPSMTRDPESRRSGAY